MSSLKNKVIFITGGTSGIGKATVKKCLQEGAKLYVMGRSQERLDNLLSEYKEYPLNGYCGSVSDEKAVKAAFDICVKKYGTVDVLINNAGVGIPTPDLANAGVEDYDQMIDTNLKGVFLCNREALKIMKTKGSGHILSVISMAGQRTNPGSPVYCASKFGARGLSGGMADQVLKLGIKVTDINPGPTDSEYWGDRDVPREKFLQVDDVANVIHFVISAPDHVLIREINFDSIQWYAG